MYSEAQRITRLCGSVNKMPSVLNKNASKCLQLQPEGRERKGKREKGGKKGR